MEKPTAQFSFTQLFASFRSFGNSGMDVTTVWHLLLSLLLAGVVGTGVFAYLTYNWAVDDAVPTPLAIGTRDTQTISEMKSIVSSYQEKEKSYLFLMAAEPDAPHFERGFGAVIPSTMRFEEELPVASSTSAAATSSPTVSRIVD